MSGPCDLRGYGAPFPQGIAIGVAPLWDPGDEPNLVNHPLTCTDGVLSTIHSPYNYCYKNFHLIVQK